MLLSQENLTNTLSIANESERSQNQQQAESQLKAWESQPGYYFTLQSIYLNLNLPLQIRWLAIICFKNGIEKYWRPSRVNAINKQEKLEIRHRLFDLLDEKNNQLLVQNAYSIGKIVRFEFPGDWPGLFDDFYNMLLVAVGDNDMVKTNNLLIILNHIVKTLISVRIGRTRHAMQSKSPIIINLLIKFYVKFFDNWTKTLDLGIMEICYLVLKNLRRLIPESLDEILGNHELVDFLKLSVTHLQLLINEHDKYSSDLIERYTKCYSKLYSNIINIDPTTFVLLPCCDDIIKFYLNFLQAKAEQIYNSNEENDFWETIALKGFMILKKLLNFIFKKGAITLKQPKFKHDITSAVDKLSGEFFTPAVVQQLCDLIINWYLLLKPSDLESWLLEPEEWCNEEMASSWEYQIRPCAENFFQDVMKYFSNDLSDYILNKISNGLNGNQNILVKDSTLCCFQLSSDSIADKVNFNQLLTEIFIPMALQNAQVEDKIIKRRICLIIGQWVRIDCSDSSKIEIYKLLLTLLSTDDQAHDQVVKLSSIQCLRVMTDDWDFNKRSFEPFLSSFIENSIKFLDQLAFTESKLYILQTLAVIIERCNPLINYQTLLSLSSIIPKYWQISESEQENILKNSLIRILKNLVISLNENSTATHEIAFPLVESCCKGDSANYQLLSEDAFELWLSIVQFYPKNQAPNDQLIGLFGMIEFGLMNLTEVLPLILSIIRSYALLSPELFTNESTTNVFRILSGYLGTMRDDSFGVFISLMDILFLQNSNNELFLRLIVETGLINSMISFVLDDSQSIVNANKILLVLSRLAYNSSDLFLQMLNYLSDNLGNFLSTWIKYYNNNGNPRNKKINLLAFISLLNVDIESYSSLFSDIVQKTVLFLEEIQEENDGKVEAYNLNLIYEDIDDYRYLDEDIKENGEKLRYMELLQKNDPVFSVNLQTYLQQVISSIKSKISPQQFDQILASLDEYSLEQLQKMA